MKKYLVLLTLLSLTLVFNQACSDKPDVESDKQSSSQKETKPEKPKMYEASELAVVMREMKADLDKERLNLEAGEDFNEALIAKYEAIKTTAPTSKKDTVGPYHGFADAFIEQLKGINNSENKLNHFNMAVQTCVNCHMQYCQGPIPAIKKLSLTVPL